MALNACDIDQQLRNAADDVVAAKRNLANSRAMVSSMILNLDGLATKYAEMISAVNAVEYGTPADEAANKAKLAGIVGAYTSLRNSAVSLKAWIDANVTEF